MQSFLDSTCTAMRLLDEERQAAQRAREVVRPALLQPGCQAGKVEDVAAWQHLRSLSTPNARQRHLVLALCP